MPGIGILQRKATAFVIWRAKPGAVLIIGRFSPGNPPTHSDQRRIPLSLVEGFDDLLAIEAAACSLVAGTVYHYWFEVKDTFPGRSEDDRILVTDPFAWSVDWRLRAKLLSASYGPDDRQPASVVFWDGTQLTPCDPAGEKAVPEQGSQRTLPVNNNLVIYELPTAWSRLAVPYDQGEIGVGVGTFQDVLAMVDENASGANFDNQPVTSVGTSYLLDLGINTLELLPPADSFFKREWGYDTTNYLAPDTELGFPEEYMSPTANRDLAALVAACHGAGIRFFLDAVMAFCRQGPMQHIAFDEFHIGDPKTVPHPPDDPDAYNSRSDHAPRDGFGSVLWRYARQTRGYDPGSGSILDTLYPARQLMLVFATRWIKDFYIDGVRLDSVENIANWDFLREFREHFRQTFTGSRPPGAPSAGDQVLVIGEELSEPMGLLKGTAPRLDALWNIQFKDRVRYAVLGFADGSFETLVREMIDCRNLRLTDGSFPDGEHAVNYITSHDVGDGDPMNIRMYNYLLKKNVAPDQVFRRIKLAFVCLLTAVGIPMVLAGEEFADQHDRFDANGNVTNDGGKQVDPVNFYRKEEPSRKDLLEYVSRLVKLRTSHPALALSDTNFVHTDFNDGKRVLVWRRGNADDPVLVIANFSDWGTASPFDSGAEYIVPGWPTANWHEETLDRDAPQAGREPLFPWEAKVYRLRT